MNKKPEKKIIHLDDLVRRCGYFATTKYRDGSWKNNGYGCTHRGNKDEPGKCFSFCCPVAYEASYNDLLELDSYLAKEYEYQLEYKDPEEESLDSEWMVVWKPLYLKRYFKEE